MNREMISLCMILLIFAAGCASTTNSSVTVQKESKSSYFEKLSAATEPTRASFRKLTKTDQPIQPRTWDWVTALPVDIKRSQLVDTTIPSDALASLVPAMKSNIAQVSWPSPTSAYRVVNIEGHKVRNCNDLFNAIENVADKQDDQIQVDLVNLSAPEGTPEIAVQLDSSQLVEVTQLIAPDQPAMRITKDGNPWIVFREQGVRCELMARTERTRGLLHVVIALANCGDKPMLLPVEVRATCDDDPLRCCSVAETLDALYGSVEPDITNPQNDECSFVSTSEKEDYRVPVNFRRIQEEMAAEHQDSAQKPVPAFASLPGQVYPGTAVLGDARALSGFLMQQQSCLPGDPEHVGWLVFADDSLCNGGAVDISIDSGNGLRTFRFNVPAQ